MKKFLGIFSFFHLIKENYPYFYKEKLVFKNFDDSVEYLCKLNEYNLELAFHTSHSGIDFSELWSIIRKNEKMKKMDLLLKIK